MLVFITWNKHVTSRLVKRWGITELCDSSSQKELFVVQCAGAEGACVSFGSCIHRRLLVWCQCHHRAALPDLLPQHATLSKALELMLGPHSDFPTLLRPCRMNGRVGVITHHNAKWCLRDLIRLGLHHLVGSKMQTMPLWDANEKVRYIYCVSKPTHEICMYKGDPV